MGVFFVTGNLGGGKGLFTCRRAKQYLQQNRRVVTNKDFFLHKLLPHDNKQTIIRIPDHPRVEDLEMLGYGCEEVDYSGEKFGGIFFDECATWFNSRKWNDKNRSKLIDWLLHARKYRWDVYFEVQDIQSLDQQLVRSLCQFVVICTSLKGMPLPGPLRFIPIKMPKMHVATTRMKNAKGYIVKRETYQGTEYYDGYDTGQIFSDGHRYFGDSMVDMRSSYTVLSAYHTYGRYLNPDERTLWQKIRGVKRTLRPLQAEQSTRSVPIDSANNVIRYINRIRDANLRDELLLNYRRMLRAKKTA